MCKVTRRWSSLVVKSGVEFAVRNFKYLNIGSRFLNKNSRVKKQVKVRVKVTNNSSDNLAK